MRQQVANLIAAGSNRATILSIVDCTSAQLDELLADESFRKEVIAAKSSLADDKIDAMYAEVEKAVLTKVKSNLEFYNPSDLTRILTSVTQNRVARRIPSQQNTHFNNPTIGIQVTVPIFLSPQGNSAVIRDSKNQVIAIEGRNMAPLPIDSVHKLFSQMDREETEKRRIENEQDPVEADYDREVERARTQAAA